MRTDDYSYLPVFDTAIVAQRKAVGGLLKWSNVHLSAHRADADEPFDQVESTGFSVVGKDTVAEPTECLAVDCANEPGTCDGCKYEMF